MHLEALCASSLYLSIFSRASITNIITEKSPPVSGVLEVMLNTALLFRYDTAGKSIGTIFESCHNVKKITYLVEV